MALLKSAFILLGCFLLATGDSSSGGGSGSGMECLQLRSPPAPFHYLLSEQAKSLVALQELQNEVGALLEFRDLVIETFPNLRSKLSLGGHPGGSGGGVTPSPASGGGGGAARRDWEPGVRVRRKLPTREADSLPRSRSDSHSKPQGKSEGAHSVVQDSGFSTETSSSKEAHSTAAPPTRQPSTYEGELWQLLDVIQHRGNKLKEEAEALRGTLGDRRALSLSALCEQDRDDDDPAEEFRRTLAVGSSKELAALRRERDMLLHRLAELEAEALAGKVEAQRLREHTLVTPTALRLDVKYDYEDRTLEFRSRPSAPGPRPSPLQSPLTSSRHSVFTPVTPVKTVISSTETPARPRRASASAGTSEECGVIGVSDSDLGKLDRVMNTPIRNLKVKTPDTKKISAILQENNPVELQRHLLMYTVHNQLLQSKLENVGRSKGTLVETLHRTREENDDLRFQLEEKTIELEGTRAHVRLLENGVRGTREGSSSGSGGGGGPRSMRALQPLPLHLQSDEEAEQDQDADRITDTPRKRPSKIPLPPSKLPPTGPLATKPPAGRSKDTPSYRSRSGDSLGRPGSSQSWRNKADGNSLSGSKSGNSISSTKSPGRNSSFITLKTNSRDSLGRSHSTKPSKDSLTGKVRNNDSLSRIRDSALSSSSSVISKGSKKDSPCGGALVNGKKSAVPVRRASSGASTRLPDTVDAKSSVDGVSLNPWMNSDEREISRDSLNSDGTKRDSVTVDEPQILRDFVIRSNQLAKDKRLYFLSSDYFHRKFEILDSKKEQIDMAYESPNNMKMFLNHSDRANKLTTMDVHTQRNTPTKSDILFFNEPFCYSYESVWNRKPRQYFDSINNSTVFHSNYSSKLHSVTNDSTTREGLAECDSLERKISFDETF